MASYRGPSPESLTRSVNRGSDFLTQSTYRPETSSDHLADSIYRPGTSSDQVSTSDSVDETRVPTRLKGYLKSRVIHHLSEADDFTADILHIPGQPARLVLKFGAQDGQGYRSTSDNARQSKRIIVRNLPPAAENEEYLDIFFESTKRQGGGPVKTVILMKDKHSAVIEFEHPDAVKRVLEKVPITMHDYVVDVDAMETLLDKDEDIDSVQIKGLQGLAEELRAMEIDGSTDDADDGVSATDRMIFIYRGLEAAKVWHFCEAELANIATNFGASITEDPLEGIPESVTITAEKKFEGNIRKRMIVIKDKVLSLQECSIVDTDITSDLTNCISDSNASNDHILLISDVNKRKIICVFDDDFTPDTAKELIQACISDHEAVLPPVKKSKVPSTVDIKREKLIVAAIEIGRTHSGYAFSFKHEFIKDPTKVSTSAWRNRYELTMNVPTVVLFDPQMNFHSFGYDAEEKYLELEEDDEHHAWHLFKRFRTVFGEAKAHSRLKMVDELGRRFEAKTVFTCAIRFLKNHLVGLLKNSYQDIYENDIHWVLMVPTVCQDSFKPFMRGCAKEAGIDDEQLSLVLQPDAGSIYCQYLPTTQTGETFMVIDLGGDMSRITAYERRQGLEQRQLCTRGSDMFCSSKVKAEFYAFLQHLIGINAFTQFRDNNQLDILDFERCTEEKIRILKPTQGGTVIIRCPVAIEECCFEQTGKGMKEAINASSYKGRLTWFGDKLKCEADIVKSFFQPCCTQLTNTVSEMLQNPQLRNTRAFLMIGELSVSPIMQDAVRKAFPDAYVVIPDLPEVAALKGAVVYGHTSIDVSYRIPKSTYGIIGPISVDGTQRSLSEAVFHTYFPKGQTVKIGAIRSNRHFIENDSLKEWEWKIYSSGRKIFSALDQSCRFLGTIILKLQAADRPVRVDVDVTFSDTELIVEAHDVNAGYRTRVSVSTDDLS